MFTLISVYVNLSAQKNYFEGRINCAIGYFHVASMPDYFRNVPIHADDGGGSGGLIEQSSYSNYFFPSLESFFLHATKKGYTWKVGFAMNFNPGDQQERNYTNAPGTSQRGFGAALTFAGTVPGGLTTIFIGTGSSIFSICFTPEVGLEIPLKHAIDKSPVLSFTGSLQTLWAVNGWDRFNTTEYNDKKLLLYTFPLDATIKFGGFVFGPRILMTFKTEAGREFKATTGPIGFIVIWSFVNTRQD